MTYSNKRSPHRTRPLSRLVFSLPALRGGEAFWSTRAWRASGWTGLGLLGLLCTAIAVAAPGPIQNHFENDAVLVALPASPSANNNAVSSPEALAQEIQRLITVARRSGDPRFLGYAEQLFNQQASLQLTDRLLVLRATLSQSLHKFEAAKQDLEAVLNRSDVPRQRAQALITLANIAMVQGHYERARPLCEQLTAEFPGLIAASCRAQVAARTGAGETAYRELTATIRATHSANPDNTLWAQGTLGDIAAQLNKDSAVAHWQGVLSQNPEDLYTRTQLADWYLQNGKPELALATTDDFEAVDSLAVIRAIALQRLTDPGAAALTARLRERFAEAKWRGAMLHQRDFARFVLDIERRPDQALQHAMANWATQREPADTRLALRAALAARDDAALGQIRDWLAQQNQSDARYPEES